MENNEQCPDIGGDFSLKIGAENQVVEVKG